jgi:hypothetical protein
MLIPNLPGHSRVWIFASNKLLSEAEIQDVSMLMNSFTAQWQSHGTQLIAAFELIHDSILIVAVDESVEPPSGCSIDKVFRLLNQTNIDFFQRTLVWIPFCNSAKIITQEQAILQYKNGDLNQESLVVNTLVDTLIQAREQLYIPLKDSWIAQKITRYNQYEG